MRDTFSILALAALFVAGCIAVWGWWVGRWAAEYAEGAVGAVLFVGILVTVPMWR